MRLRTLLASAAALASMTGAANADVVYQGSVTTNAIVFGIPISIGPSNNTVAVLVADLLNPSVNSNTSLITIAGLSVTNNGSASLTDGASFTLQGTVSKDCAYYSGNVNTTIDFGQIGIYASDNTGPALAFDQVADAAVSIETNLAGCNTRNTVAIAKGNSDGMHTNNGSSFDPVQFTNVLPYRVAAGWTGVADGSFATGPQSLNLSVSEQAKNTTQGAWKSAMDIDVVIPAQSKSLVSGTYSDTLTVTLTAL
jgi:hypothetical protein